MTSLAPASNRAGAHQPALDGFRGLAILMVVMHHCLAGKPDESASLFEWALRGTATAFWMGVDCFFVLSGFLITGILLDTRGRPHALRNFLARRALRTLPLYYATLFVCFVVVARLPERFPAEEGLRALASEQLWFWLHVSNFYNVAQILTGSGPPVGWLSTFWSLSVEEHFYLFWAFAVILGGGARLGLFAGILLAGTLGLRIALALGGLPDQVVYYCTFTRLDALLLGALLAIAVRRPGGIGRLVPIARVVFPISAIAMLVPSVGLVGSSFFGETFRYSLAALVFASLLVLTIDAERDPRSRLNRFLSQRALRACGKYSYAMYVFNKPIIAMLWGIFFRLELPIALGRSACLVAFFVAALLLTFGAAFASWHLLEKHFLKLKRRFATPLEGSA